MTLMSRNSQQRLLTQPTKSNSTSHPQLKLSWQIWQRKIYYFYLRFLRLRGSPESIARGLAAGVFAGLFPFIATQTLIAILIAALIRGNKIVAATATWISNPFTAVPLYAFNFQIGRWLLNYQETFSPKDFQSWENMMDLGTDFLTALLLGCLVVATIASIGTYFLGLRFIQQVRNRKRRRKSIDKVDYLS